MSESTLTRLEAMLVSLRDQLDCLADRVDGRLAEQQLLLTRLRLDVARLQTPILSSGRRHAGDQGQPTE